LPSRRKLRLIHTSDTHLGGDWHAQLAQDALQAVVEAVPRLGGDALLIVGDVFDHARVSDQVLEFFLEQMGRLRVPAVVLPGNHDLYDAQSLYLRKPFNRQPANLHIFTRPEGEVISFPELALDLWGRAMTLHTPEFRPLDGMPHGRGGRWLVALAHAHFHFEGDREQRSSPIFPHDVAQAPCDYLALGHWDRHTDVSRGRVKAIYSGAPVETAGTGQVTVVDLDPAAGVETHQATIAISLQQSAVRPHPPRQGAGPES
jgi:DNA repair exonuclease SbcCD nuclease subunit